MARATRAFQGIGAALMVPSSLAILNDACAHDSRLRARAIGIWTAAGGVALTAPIGAIIEARPLGLTHPIVAAGSLLALTAGAAFIAVETRTASPMLPLYFFRLPGCTPAIVFGVLINCTYYGIIFVLSLYLQKALGYSTVQAGLAFLPLTSTFIASNIASGWMAGRIGSRAPMILGCLIGAEPWSNL